MKKTIKVISIIVTMGIMLVLAYWLGTTQAKIITEIKKVEKTVEVVPDGYINMYSEEFRENFVDMREIVYFELSDDGLQLYFVNGSGYWLER